MAWPFYINFISMDFYSANVVGLIALNVVLSYNQWKRQIVGASSSGEKSNAAGPEYKQFKWSFLPVYLLVFGADWLQVWHRQPCQWHLNLLARVLTYTPCTEVSLRFLQNRPANSCQQRTDEKGLAEETVAYLFTTGFLAAALSATFVGSLADCYGRRTACRFFCMAYSASCITILFDDILILFSGRILGGLSTTLMYSVFESWLVTEYHRQHLDDAGGSLNDMFGIMTTLNSVVAVIAGLFAQGVSDFTGTQKAPFMTAVVCLVLAFLSISRQWVSVAEHRISNWNGSD